MTPPHHCEYCGRELPSHAPGKLCPECLLELAVAELGFGKEAEDSGGIVQNAKAEDLGASREGGKRRFGSYELLEKIGEGGMGVVYKARQVNLDRLVAIKLLPFGALSRQEVVQRFRREAAAAASLQHPSIVAIHDIGEEEGQYYFSMDLVVGPTLAELVRDQPLPARRAATYLKSIAEAVHYAHERGVLHRDLKPPT